MKIKRLYWRRTAIILLLGILSACAAESGDITLRLHPDQDVPLSDFRGKWLLINYWAIWCKPCAEEIPELNRLNQSEDIRVLASNFDRQQGEVLDTQLKQLDIRFPSLLSDATAAFAQPPPSGLPATLVIDPDGKFRQWLVGPQDEAKVRRVLGL